MNGLGGDVRRGVCLHEAAHAVVGITLDVIVEGMRLTRTGGVTSTCDVIWDPTWFEEPPPKLEDLHGPDALTARIAIEARVLTALAGPAVERVAAQRGLYDDIGLQIIRGLYPPSESSRADETRARRLLERFSASKAESHLYYELLQMRIENYVRNDSALWSKVEAVAGALSDHGELACEDILAIVAGAIRRDAAKAHQGGVV